jgi:hypothetical protein
VILKSGKNTNNSSNFDEKVKLFDRIDVNSNADLCLSVDEGKVDNNQVILPNSVRLSSSSSITLDREELWDDFRKYLINEGQRKDSVRNKVGYAKRYCQVLDTKDARVLQNLSHGSKVHTMKALGSLSKFLGSYDEWLEIIKKYQLKWSKPDKSTSVLKSIIDSQNNGNDLDSMVEWIKKVSAVLPLEYKNILLFNTLTGLRPDEAQKSIWLIKTKENEYFDDKRGILKHYCFPTIFLRQTKNVYLTVIDEKILEIAKTTPRREHYYDSLRKWISIKNGFGINMYFCRKVFATYLRNKGIEPEIIDLLQGRISSSVFVNHYYRPNISEIITERIRPVLKELMIKLS